MMTFAVRPGRCQSCGQVHLQATHLAFGPQRGPREATVVLCPEDMALLGLALLEGRLVKPIGVDKKGKQAC